MTIISKFLASAVDIIWGPPLIFLLMGGGIVLLWYSRFLPLFYFKTAIELIIGRKSNSDKAPGQLSHFQALTNALSATVGMGNIAGVAVAIYQGGPGALFWMWMSALIGMNTKFFECTLSVKYRGRDYQGETQGGPMYVMKEKLGRFGKPLAFMFTSCGLIGTLALFQVNQLTKYLNTYYEVPKISVGIVLAIVMGLVLQGGVKRIGKISSILVPGMAIFYFIVGSYIILINYQLVPIIFEEIITQAFGIKAMTGAGMGIAFMQVFKIGVKRAAFSNEAGIGTAPMAHSNAKTNEPVDEGLVAMLGPFIDTIIICTITAFVILIGLKKSNIEVTEGVMLTTRAFESALPGFGQHFLGVAILLFSTTTILGMANYNQKCWNFLFKGRRFLGLTSFKIYYLSTLIIASKVSSKDVVNLIDLAGGMMAFPNMIVTIYFAKEIMNDFKLKTTKKSSTLKN
jgi:alanine or glycine:cation symporter, AGCS family